MRVPLATVLLTLPLLAAGCVAELGASVEPAGLLSGIDLPEGATLLLEEGRTVLRFLDVDLPFKENVTIPAGTTVVRLQAEIADDLPLLPGMAHQETGRRRCNADRLDAWDLAVTKVSTCSGLAAIDPPGAVWTISVAAPAAVEKAVRVDVVFETTPLDGIVGSLDLSQLSMPVHELRPTEYLTVESFDGTPLWVEVTLPEGPGPWPTILASSPYNGIVGRGALPGQWEYWVHDWAKRGYAAVMADVRGFGMSGGCVEVWGPNEQKDQAFLVDWVASQAWSDGNVGFYGQSYVATTPVEAAVQAPPALKAIVAVAPVVDAYNDWHFGGVPNGESSGSVLSYQGVYEYLGYLPDVPPSLPPDVATPEPPEDPLTYAIMKGHGLCDPTLVARANDPRAIYDGFYVERNFTARAGNIKAAVLYTQGFLDSNVKSAMIPGWFDAIQSPKLGLFGQWVHQHPTRADEEILFLGWMDQYVKGKPLGLDRVEKVHVIVDDAHHRVDATWPPASATHTHLPADGLLGALPITPEGAVTGPAAAVAEIPIPEAIALAGIARIAIEGTLLPAGNAHFLGRLYDVDPAGEARLVTHGGFNLAHREGHDSWNPSAPGETTAFELPFLPTEYVFAAGHTIRLLVVGAAPEVFGAEGSSQPGVYDVGSASLVLPTAPVSAYETAPATATR